MDLLYFCSCFFAVLWVVSWEVWYYFHPGVFSGKTDPGWISTARGLEYLVVLYFVFNVQWRTFCCDFLHSSQESDIQTSFGFRLVILWLQHQRFYIENMWKILHRKKSPALTKIGVIWSFQSWLHYTWYLLSGVCGYVLGMGQKQGLVSLVEHSGTQDRSREGCWCYWGCWICPTSKNLDVISIARDTTGEDKQMAQRYLKVQELSVEGSHIVYMTIQGSV